MSFPTNQDFIEYTKAVMISIGVETQREIGIRIGLAENVMSDCMGGKKLIDIPMLLKIVGLDPDYQRVAKMLQLVEWMQSLGIVKFRTTSVMLTTIGIEEPKFEIATSYFRYVLKFSKLHLRGFSRAVDIAPATVRDILNVKRKYIRKSSIAKIEKLSDVTFDDYCLTKGVEIMPANVDLETPVTSDVVVKEHHSLAIGKKHDSMKADFIELLKDFVPRRIDSEKVYNDISDKVDVTLAEIRGSSNPTQLTDKLRWLLITQHLKGLMQGHVFWLEGSMDRVSQKLK